MTMAGPAGDGQGLFHKLAAMPVNVWGWMKHKAGTFLYEAKQQESAWAMPVSKDAVSRLGKQLSAQPDHPPGQKPGSSFSALAGMEAELLKRIRQDTALRNMNNVARTQAYYAMYRRFPELHWAFLAHMVSRNGGWSMTDLKGELIPHLLGAAQIEHTFQFLERANALIFHDAYPQLLLYEESRRLGRPLFHLLPHLGVSAFMSPVWELFWDTNDSALLTTGLIINEQSYIERRIVKNSYFREHVLDTLFFQSQSLLQLNQVVFPYTDNEDISLAEDQLGRLRLAGLTVENFGDLDERIGVGKKLYGILFGLPDVRFGAERFAAARPHTGSRADYWPHLFAPVRRSPPGPYAEKLHGCELRQGAAPLYSPKLEDAWKNRAMAPAEPGDWFDSLGALRHFGTIEPPRAFEMSLEACTGLHKLELAVLAGEVF
ncbi:DUF2515 domain-containing protein [Paenibacillus hamazuiensis]|uniref:DUF2515 domain-containing protein n=1 Tax=Paenibacillus hamazuiensis TaxID=2936508 RepID=UPI00200D00B9|nr:DUF2515 domain-containing protein [Paenibacillus hamazuiensis]